MSQAQNMSFEDIHSSVAQKPEQHFYAIALKQTNARKEKNDHTDR